MNWRVLIFWFGFTGTSLVSAGQINVQLDNDVVFGTDRQYTGGFEVRWTEDQIPLVDALLSPFESFLPSKNISGFKQADQLAVCTELYTLQQKTEHGNEAISNSAWTHIDWRRFYWYGKNQSILDFRAGWIGPSSGGRQIQDGVHSLIGNDNASGWDKQVPDQPTLQVGFENRHRFFSSENQHFKVGHSLSGAVGSPQIYAAAGIGMQYGVDMEAVMSFNRLNHLIVPEKGFGWLVFIDASVRYEAYNAFRDGRLFVNERTSLKPANDFIPSVQYGAGFVYNKVSVVLSGSSFGKFYREQTEEVFRFASLIVSFPV
ncbi:MAG: hypothetical protein DSZ27_00010 [Thiomicrospira sp.]|nr:MAG: hypothetical protein DSZ27_00010 [Thiomicrospira sp.]